MRTSWTSAHPVRLTGRILPLIFLLTSVVGASAGRSIADAAGAVLVDLAGRAQVRRHVARLMIGVAVVLGVALHAAAGRSTQ